MHLAAHPKATGVIRAFGYAQYDPISILFGAHMLIINSQAYFALQAILGVTAIVCMAVFGVFQADFLRICCYSVYPPTAATFLQQGACNSPGTLAHIQSDGTCVHAMPSTNIALLVTGIFAFIADFGVYIHGHAEYLPAVRKFLDKTSSSKKRSRAIMLFPVTGILLGTYERVTSLSVIYHIRILLLGTIVSLSVYLSIALDMNYAWGCYPSFRSNSDGDIDSLVWGRCDVPTSPAARYTDNGHFRLWSSSLAIWCSLAGLGIAWLGLYMVRWTGWKPHIDSIDEELHGLL